MEIHFSCDTVRIDTLFSGIGSATKRIKVYNPNANAINFESIELMHGEQSGFRMMVNGRSGNLINNEPLYGGDSLFILLEITVSYIGSDAPLLIRDSVCFSYNGTKRFLQLEAVGQDAIIWHGKVIESDTTLTAEKPFLIYDSLFVATEAHLRILEGVKLHFHDKAGVFIAGRLTALGTTENPVIFRGDRYDNIIDNIPYNNLPGQWGGIVIDSLSFNNKLENVRVFGTLYGLLCKPSNTETPKILIHNTIVQNSSADCLKATNCRIDASNSLFANAKVATVNLTGGHYSFTHCTLANYISWSSMSHTTTLILQNAADFDRDAPIEKADFINCIIYGSGFNEIHINKLLNQVTLEHLFQNCLLRAEGEDDTAAPIHFTHNIWNEEPGFINLNDSSDFSYNFRLDTLSAAINRADPVFSVNLPNDLYGISRLSDAAPDMGCFEWIKEEE
jgi:hypothetical protein